jgi:TonB family protein
MSAERKPDLHLEIAHVLFIDVVGYSKLLADEQSETLQLLNQIVRGTAEFRTAEEKGELIRLPTGDGMALVYLTKPEAPVQCALEIGKAIKSFPELQLRMGIHSGSVNQMRDVNDRSNVTGAGINIAQRVMDCGDAGHILLSRRVAEDLEQYRLWQPYLHDLGECEVKHGVRVHVFNLYTDEVGNRDVPAKLKPIAQEPPPSTALPKTNLWMWRGLMWGCVVAAGLFALFLVVIILQRRSPPGPQANVPTPVPAVTEAPTVALPPSTTPDQRAYALSKFLPAKQAFQQHDLATASKLIDEADSADPNQPAILNLRGEILTEQKEYELAEAAFRKAIEIDSDFYEAKQNLASMLWKKDAEKSKMPSPTVTPQISPAESPTVAKRMPGEQFPETRSWIMSSWDVENWTPAQVRYAINEMYARHGADFLDKEIKRQFTAFEWYHPRSGQTYDETEKLFSTIELYNLKLLGSYRDARKAGVPPKSAPGGSSPPSNSTQQQTARKPKIVYAPHPAYPAGADKMRVTGSGRFKITFDERGNAKSVEIVRSTGSRLLDSNTIKTLKLWRAAPGSPFYVVVPIDYRPR